MKRTRIKSISPNRKSRIGKEGIVRLHGKDRSQSRVDLYFAAHGYCQMREILLAELAERDDMTPEHRLVASATITQNCWRWVSLAHGHDAHLRAKRNNGDELENRVWSCPPCHQAGDHNSFGKPCPPKPELAGKNQDNGE